MHTPAGDALALGGGGDGGDGGGGGGATSEVATFGVFLSSRGGGEELRNEAAGVGARTRPAPTRRTRTLPGWATRAAHTQLRAGAEEGGCGAPGCLVSTAGQAARREAAGPPFFLLRDESEPERQAPSFLICFNLEFRIFCFQVL